MHLSSLTRGFVPAVALLVTCAATEARAQIIGTWPTCAFPSGNPTFAS